RPTLKHNAASPLITPLLHVKSQNSKSHHSLLLTLPRGLLQHHHQASSSSANSSQPLFQHGSQTLSNIQKTNYSHPMTLFLHRSLRFTTTNFSYILRTENTKKYNS